MSTPTPDDLSAALAAVQTASSASGAWLLGTSPNRALTASVITAASLCSTGLRAVNQDIGSLMTASAKAGTPLPVSSILNAIGLLKACESASAYLAMAVTTQGYVGRISANLKTI